MPRKISIFTFIRLSRIMILLCIVDLTIGVARADDKWFASLYVGQFSNTALNEIVRFNTRLESSEVYVLSLGKELTRYKDKLGIEVEGQVGAHSGEQNHMEINAALTLRWHPFPWDRYVDTSLAFGNGISYAFEDPPLEIREADDEKTSKTLYYILVELAFSVPQRPQWDLFVRIHHRSSVFGLINGLFAASNFVGMGVRYHF